MSPIDLPTYESMMNPTLQALKSLGGSATNSELFKKVAEIMKLSEEQVDIIHDPERGSLGEIEYRLAWTRTYLKKYGLLDNSIRGVWSLTQKGNQTDEVNPKLVTQYFREQKKKEQASQEEDEFESEAEFTWRDVVLTSLLEMDADSFERLIQRVLRESGFIQVEVTGRSGDGGIDGKGIMRLGGLMSFHVIFQCKRYQGSVSASTVRDFRGAMVGRADKGLLITSGNFTKGAVDEATRDGAPALDLIDGEQLIDILKDLELGIKTEIVQVENVTIDRDWFMNI